MKVEGLEELMERLGRMSERADKAVEAVDGKDAAQVRAALQLRAGTHRSPLMSQEHARMVASGEATEKEMYDVYWTIEDVAKYLTED